MLVLAGAGSGKTRVITSRVAHLIHQGVGPRNILAITFTNKAAGEMRDRVARLGVPGGATVCTFHALCARLLREYAAEAGISQNYSIYDRDDQVKLVKKAMERLELPSSKLRPVGVHGAISRAKNDLKTPAQLNSEDANFYMQNVAKVFGEYERLLAANNALDFDDLLLRVAMLMRDRPEIRQRLSQRFRYVLIDEYQDTNRAQYVIAHSIALDHENLCATGDPDQSIYAWRGADVNNILEFEADYPNAVVIRLEENYRSTRPILATASRLISCNRMRKDKSLWTRRSGGENVRVVRCDDEHAEAQHLCERIAGLRRAGRAYSDMAVFYRVNALSRVVEEVLLRAAVPYRIARGVEFYNRKEIKDILAYLKLLANPADDLSCLRIINTPARGIGATTVSRLVALARRDGLSLLAAARAGEQAGLKAASAKKTAAFAALIDSLGANLHRPVRNIVEDVYNRSGLEKSLRQDDEQDSQACANVEELISTAAEFDENADEQAASLVDYLQRISLVSDVDHFEGSAGAVTLMTLHAAKGLEFPVVFMIGCEQGLLPFEREVEDATDQRYGGDQKLEEERRLAFVGMTRAKDLLNLSCARYRMIRGRTVPQVPSMFLDELAGEDVTSEDLAGGLDCHPRARRRRGGGGFYADVQERAIIEVMGRAHNRGDSEVPYPPEYEYLRVGCRIRHPRFGEGQVTRLRQPWPQTRAEILFDDCGPKTIVLAATSVEVL